MNLVNSDNSNHKSLRVRTNIGDKFLNVNLDQTYESLDILSLKVYQKDIYRLFDADYGIIVGRVLGQGIGIPNAKISVFIPSEEENVATPTTLDDIKKMEAASVYPFQTVYDKDGNGKVYNLLPKYKKFRGFNGFSENEIGIGATPKTPVGTFPEKEEILTNETLAYVYDKYLKFSTITNESGDYILVVPSNRTYTVNMSCDITDIGKFSVAPALLKKQGYPENFFLTTNGVQINPDLPLEELPNVDIQNQSIYVKPLWSQNPDNTNVGINRLDFKINKRVDPFTTIISNCICMNYDHYWNRCGILDVGNSGLGDEGIDSALNVHVPAQFDLMVFNIKNTVSEADADLLNIGDTFTMNKYHFDNDIELLDSSKYQVYYDNGSLVVTILCNRGKIITNEFGETVSVGDNETGVFTSFRGYLFFNTDAGNVTNPDDTDLGVKTKLKVPQLFDYFGPTNYSLSFLPDFTSEADIDKYKRPWIWKHYKFEYGEIYGIAQYSDVRAATLQPIDEFPYNQTNILYLGRDFLGSNPNYQLPRPNANYQTTRDGFYHNQYINFYNHLKEYSNWNGYIYYSLKNQWINFTIRFMHAAYDNSYDFSDAYIIRRQRTKGNQPQWIARGIGGKQGYGNVTIHGLANGEHIKTDFFKADKEDLIKLYDYKINGNTQLGIKLPKSELKAPNNYPRQNIGGSHLNWINQDSGDTVGERYFLIGNYSNNVIKYLFDILRLF